MNQEYWRELNNDAEQHLKSAIELFEEATEAGISWALEGGGSEKSLGSLRDQLSSVEKMELRLPIVAPMKAGKSTIINAIVGSDVLPARSEAMTALPTMIELVDGIDQPELVILADDARIYSDLAEKLAGQVDRDFDQLADRYAHLESLLIQVKGQQVEPVEEHYAGRVPVLEILTRLNDLIRLAAVLLPNEDVIGQLSSVPRLRTPYWRRPGEATSSATGTLILIDTPGPDENKVAARLTGAVRSALQTSHVVLVVLDYTAMGREADDRIKELTEPVVRELGVEKIYAVVNKVDQRRPGTLDEAQDKDRVRRFVQVDLQLVDAGGNQRIFETKGRLGLVAARVLAALQHADGQFSIATDPAARDLIWEQFEDPQDRKDALAKWDVDRLQIRATKKWEESGIPQMLEEAIGRLQEGAIPLLLDATLTRQVPLLTSLVEVANLRIKADSADEQSIRDQLAELNGEVKELKGLRAKKPNADQLHDMVGANLDNSLKTMRENGERILAQLDPHPQPVPRQQGRGNPLTYLAQQAGDLVDQVVKKAASMVGSGGSSEVMEFPSQEEAQRHIERLTAAVMPALRSALEAGRDEMAAKVATAAASVIKKQDEKARPIIERASQRLSDAFDITLKVPRLTVSTGDIKVTLARPTAEQREAEKSREVEQMVREWGFWLKIVPRKKVVTETYTETETVYKVDQRTVKRELSNGFTSRLEQIATELKGYVAVKLGQQLKTYYDGLDAYLQRYQQSLEQALAETAESEAQHLETVARLTGIRDAAQAHLTAETDLQRQIRELINKPAE